MAYKIALNENPISISGADIKVLVRIVGLCMNASEYECYKVVSWREKISCFIDWEYNARGEFVSIKYNEKQGKISFGDPTVTHWDYLKEVNQKLIDKADNLH